MSAPIERTVAVGGAACRVWEKGQGRRIFWLASGPMLLRWTTFHEAVANEARLVALSLPGYPGSDASHLPDDQLSWCLAARDLLEAAGFQAGDILMGSSTAGALAAEVAALWPQWVGSLVLIAPFGLFDEAAPTRDMFALHPKVAAAMVSADPATYAAQVAAPDEVNPVLWNIEIVRSNAAAARFLWPLGDTRLAQRLGRVRAPTAIVWGAEDQILPPSYAQRFASAVGSQSSVFYIPAAGHLAELDQPRAVAEEVLRFAG